MTTTNSTTNQAASRWAAAGAAAQHFVDSIDGAHVDADAWLDLSEQAAAEVRRILAARGLEIVDEGGMVYSVRPVPAAQ